jgi:hypothetical protein
MKAHGKFVPVVLGLDLLLLFYLPTAWKCLARGKFGINNQMTSHQTADDLNIIKKYTVTQEPYKWS